MYDANRDSAKYLNEKLKSEAPFFGAYLLCGQEEYLKRHYLSLIRQKLIADESAAAFDHIRLRGDAAAAPLSERLEAAMATLAVFSPTKLIEISEPQLKDMKRAELEAFCAALADAAQRQDTAIVMLLGEEELQTADYRAAQGALFRALADAAQLLVFPLQPRAKLVPWCQRHFAKLGITASAAAAGTLVDTVGRAMDALDAEIGKLCAYCHAAGRDTVNESDIALVCPRNPEGRAFGMSDAILNRQVDGALTEYALAKRDRADEIQIFGQIMATLLDLYRISQAKAEGLPPAKITALFHYKPARLSVLQRGAANYTKEELQALVRLGMQTDWQLKYTMAPKQMLIERLLCAVGRA